MLNQTDRDKGRKPTFPYLQKLENRLGEKFGDDPAYYFINPIHFNWAIKKVYILIEEKEAKKTFLDLARNTEKIYNEITKTKEFKKILSETEKYKTFVEKQWNKNQDFVFNYFKNTLGLKLPSYTITTYICHPKSFNGSSDYETKSILWGHTENCPNYSTIYLSHEILHIITYTKTKDFNTMHALIELASDNELRIRLNKKGGYPVIKGSIDTAEMPLHIRKLIETEKKAYPYWIDYLKDKKGRNIIDLAKEIETKLKQR